MDDALQNGAQAPLRNRISPWLTALLSFLPSATERTLNQRQQSIMLMPDKDHYTITHVLATEDEDGHPTQFELTLFRDEKHIFNATAQSGAFSFSQEVMAGLRVKVLVKERLPNGTLILNKVRL